MGEKMKKILYVDIPFIDNCNADGLRSRFIWELLSKNFEADLLLIKTPEYLTKPSAEHSGYDQIYTLTTSIPNPLKPTLVYQFIKENLDKFSLIISRNRYELIVFRRMNCAELAILADKTLPDCTIVIDIDTLPSRHALQDWQHNQNWKNLKTRAETYKLKTLESSLFKQPFHFFFANAQDKELALFNTGLPKDNENFGLLLNALPDDLASESTNAGSANIADKYILFYGNPANPANEDAFLYLSKEIYPRVSRKLQEKDIKVYVVGADPKPIYEQYSGGRIKLINSIENPAAYIKNCLFVILPLRKAADSESRILQSALLQKPVLTTTQGSEGFAFCAQELCISDNIESISTKIIEMVQSEDKTKELGIRLYNKVQGIYNRDGISRGFLDYLQALVSEPTTIAGKLKARIALIVNRFWTEQNDESYNVYQQAKQLAEFYDVTVYCPRRANNPKLETIDNINVIRLFDIFNYPTEFPNDKERTLCPELFFHLVKQKYDIIQCYPRLNGNTMLAFLAAKLTEAPLVLCTHDFLDYALVFEETGQVNPGILKKTALKWYDKAMLRNLDYIFANSEKEYAFLRKFNERIEQVPTAIKEMPAAQEQSSLREAYNLDEDTFVFLCVGKITFLNGQDITLKAFTRSLPHLQNARLVYAGMIDTESEFYEDLSLFIEREALQDEVIFVNSTDEQEMSDWFGVADIIVNSARFMNAGTLDIQSWMNNKPVLQSDAVDTNPVIEDENGYLFRSEDVDDLAMQMQKALAQKSTLSNLAKRGKELVRERHTFEFLVKRYTIAYKRILNLNS